MSCAAAPLAPSAASRGAPARARPEWEPEWTVLPMPRAARRPSVCADRDRVEGESVVNGQHVERGRQDPVWDVRPAAGWREFVACPRALPRPAGSPVRVVEGGRPIARASHRRLRSPPCRPGRRSPVAVSTRPIPAATAPRGAGRSPAAPVHQVPHRARRARRSGRARHQPGGARLHLPRHGGGRFAPAGAAGVPAGPRPFLQGPPGGDRGVGGDSPARAALRIRRRRSRHGAPCTAVTWAVHAVPLRGSAPAGSDCA